MKQKVVIKVSFNGNKCRTKALKVAVSVSGVEAAGFGGQDKNQIEVTGDVDAVELTTLLRKSVGHAELVSVSAVKEEKGKDEENKENQTWLSQYVLPPPAYIVQQPAYQYHPYYNDPSCSIM